MCIVCFSHRGLRSHFCLVFPCWRTEYNKMMMGGSEKKEQRGHITLNYICFFIYNYISFFRYMKENYVRKRKRQRQSLVLHDWCSHILYTTREDIWSKRESMLKILSHIIKSLSSTEVTVGYTQQKSSPDS